MRKMEKAFGWKVIEIDGNDHKDLKMAFEKAKLEKEKPTVIIANTIKGKGISFMEKNILWHYRFPHNGWEYDCAVNELHRNKPEGIEDPYTPEGIKDPELPDNNEEINDDHTLGNTWHPNYWK